MNLVRAWKDPEYRAGLANVPAHPAGPAEMTRLEISELSAAGAVLPTFPACAIRTFTLTIPIYCTISLNLCP